LFHYNFISVTCEKNVSSTLKIARYHLDRADIVVLPQNIATTAWFIQEDLSHLMIPLVRNRLFWQSLIKTSTLIKFQLVQISMTVDESFAM
jgi:hypothetical protein